MPPIPDGGTVAVTGSAGFIGGHIVKQLLSEGYRVKACVRDTSRSDRCDFLRAMPAFRTGRLTLHNGDVDTPAIFDDILVGCQGFCHVSHVSDYGNEEYVRGVAENLIGSINASGTVCRVIFTSSTAGVAGPVLSPRRPDYGLPVVMYEERYPDEEDPGRIRTRKTHSAYSVSKVLSQHLFAAAAEESGGKWDAITLCPSDNVGPILSPHQKDMGPWQHNIELLLRGVYPSVYPGSVVYRPWSPVDVRDCALGHVRLLQSLDVRSGERYIAWLAEQYTLEYISERIATLLPELGYSPPPPVADPNAIQGKKEELEGIWLRTTMKNDRIRQATGITFRNFDESLRDCVESLVAVAGVEAGSFRPKL